MRASGYLTLPLPYIHFLHAHSHVAFQGWIYTAIFLLLTSTFVDDGQIEKGRYLLQFRLTVITLFGILIAFLFQGYGPISIGISTLFQGLNYWFFFRFFNDSNRSLPTKAPEALLIKSGILFGILSTLAPYFIGYLAATGRKSTDLYDSAIYFFLHFQYNGFFLLTLLGLWTYSLRSLIPEKDRLWLRKGAWLIVIATPLSYFMSLLGNDYREIAILPSILAATLLLPGIYLIGGALLKWSVVPRKNSNWGSWIWKISIFTFFLKTILQVISITPSLEFFAFSNRNIVIAYMHLVLIGTLSLGFISIFIQRGWIPIDPLSRTGFLLLLLGFFITEMALIHSALSGDGHPMILLIFSGSMLTGILLILFSVRSSSGFNFQKKH